MKNHVITVVMLTTVMFGCGSEDKPPVRVAPQYGPPVTSIESIEGQQTTGEYVRFPAVGVKLRMPEGLVRSRSFSGFESAGTQSSILVLSVPGPYSAVTAGFTKEHMSVRGWTLQSKQDLVLGQLAGMLVHFEQPALGDVYLKWSLAFGDAQKVTMVTATFPKSRERELSTRLRAAVLSTRLDSADTQDSGAELPFTLTTSPKLKRSPGITNTLSYTMDGVIPISAPKYPLFVAAPSIRPVDEEEDKREFAEEQLRELAQIRFVTVKSSEAITLAGLSGFELLAEAEDVKSGTPMVVYQVILFDGSSFIRMLGMVGTELRDEYLPEFKTMARSMKKK
jgi:hypothetical protein